MRSEAEAVGALRRALTALRRFTPGRIAVAVCAGASCALIIGLATALIPNPVFGRDIAPVWWNYPVWALTSALMGVLTATYVGRPGVDAEAGESPGSDRSGPMGVIGGVLAWFAVGCPVCNKLALLALGYSGAIAWFAPFQPLLALAALILVGAAVVRRLAGEIACPVRPPHSERRSEPAPAGGRG